MCVKICSFLFEVLENKLKFLKLSLKKGSTKEFVCLFLAKIRQITTTKGRKIKKPVQEDVNMCFSKINTNYIPIYHSNLLVFQYMQQ